MMMFPEEFAVRRATSPLVVIVLETPPTVLAVSVEFAAVTQVPDAILMFELATMMFVRPLRTLIVPPNELPVLLRFVPKLLLELKVAAPPIRSTPDPDSIIAPELARAL